MMQGKTARRGQRVEILDWQLREEQQHARGILAADRKADG
jgi:hypothetical protein